LLTPKVGYFDGELVRGKDVVGLADLPSREELLVKLLQTLLAGPRQVMGVIRAPARDLLYLLNNYANKLESEQNG
jgi:ribosomal protein L10